jgi:hypothetical protein
MLNDSRTKHVGTVDRRRSVTGMTIAPGSILLTGTAGGGTTAIRETKVFKAIAAIDRTIATNEITGTIGAENYYIRATLGANQAAYLSALLWH